MPVFKSVIKVVFGLLLTQSLFSQIKQPFSVGEELHYSAWFNFIKGGKSDLALIALDTLNDRPVYHIKSETKSLPFFDRLYKVRDQMESWIDTSGYFSYRFRKSLREGHYRKKYAVDFNYDTGLSHSENDQDSIPDNVQDGLSMFYYVRSLDIEIGDIIPINYFDNDSLMPFLIEVQGIETVKAPIGKMECYVLAPYLESGQSLKHKSKITIYLSTDRNRVPVLISNEARFGSLILKLESIKN